MNRYAGRRFAAFALSLAALVGGFFGGDPNVFGAFSMSLTGLYGLYLGGQTLTDSKKAP